jgi:hypothetical protein
MFYVRRIAVPLLDSLLISVKDDIRILLRPVLGNEGYASGSVRVPIVTIALGLRESLVVVRMVTRVLFWGWPMGGRRIRFRT